MSARIHHSGVLALLAFALLLASCNSDGILGPPDGAACTRGTLTLGELHNGEVTVDDCVLWNEYQDFEAPAESWTLHAKANTAYIVRLRPVPNRNAVNSLNAELVLYGRNSAGDAIYGTGYWGNFGNSNVNGGVSKELVFTTATDQTVSLRVQSYSESNVGAYTIEALSCPVVTLLPGATSAPVTLGPACTVLGGSPLPETRVAFFNLAASAFEDIILTATRTAGTAEMMFHIGGPDLDASCDTGDCVGGFSSQGTGPIVLSGVMPFTGYYTVTLLQQTAGTLTATMGLTVVPAP